jgi:hypothetical protein
MDDLAYYGRFADLKHSVHTSVDGIDAYNAKALDTANDSAT